MDEHIIEALGKAKIKVKNGKVVEVGEPKIDYCPIFDKYRGIKKLTPETIKENIEFRIEDFGMCTEDRTMRMHDFLSFGVSETLTTILKEGEIDAVVSVCEGCGTVILTEPELVQGTGGRVSGLVSTCPIEKLMEEVGQDNVLDPANASIDQIAGTMKAIEMGFKKIAVTIVSADDAIRLREIEAENKDVNIFIFVAHVTEMSEENAITIFNHADVVTGCASKYIRNIGKEKEYFVAGDSIPIFGVTDTGKRFMELRIEKIGGMKDKKDPKIPKPLI
ncbi:methanogenesis marker protein 8 [Methanobacterium lacus]|uniref:Methanogenesis marker protein 8 n=1 Tax=Methanobacterium lacus (strain AL-21) TaxID=877455 RepID=F0T748_METLA|nr:methanogenesis marker 8 protein [Methanobacterium lacus]ADZ10682.1 methanogenesis marker protein 8 [Methanobacterium lacus]